MTSPTRALEAADKGPLEIGAIVAGLSAHYSVSTGAKRLVRRTRLDTFDRRLRAAGLTLEHQIAASGERLVLVRKAAPSTLLVLVNDLRWPALVNVLPSGPVRNAIAPVTGIRALIVVSDERRRIQQVELHNKNGKTVARLELDEPASAAASPAPLRVHTLRGYEEQARRADRLLVGLGLRPVEHDEDREPKPASPTSGMDRA